MASSSWDPGEKARFASTIGVGGDSTEVAVVAVEQMQPLKVAVNSKKLKKERGCTAKERISKMPPCTAGKRSSIYRGVTRHRWTGRYEAHLWDKSTWNQNQNKKGKQVYLGAYDDEEAAARAYDLAALKYWGSGTIINFPVSDYKRDLDEMKNVPREKYLGSLRRKSSGFSRGFSGCRGLYSRWDSSLARVSGSDILSKMSYGDDPEREATDNFSAEKRIDLATYIKWWRPTRPRAPESILKSSDDEKIPCKEEDNSAEQSLSGWTPKPTNSYEMPSLGAPRDANPCRSKISAMAILSQSAAYGNMKEKALKKLEKSAEDSEKENTKADNGKAVEKVENCDSGMGIGEVCLQKNWYPLAPFMSAPLLNNFGNSESLEDSMIWTSLVPNSPSASSPALNVAKTESISKYGYFQQED